MRWWTPDPDAPQLLDWWAPLVRASRLALAHEVPWLIVLDEWALEGRVERQRRPAIWVYRHRRSGGLLQVDDTGQSYKFIRHSGARSLGRFKEIEIRYAVWHAGLPHVSDGIWFERPRHGPDPPEWDETVESGPALRVVR